MTNNSFSNKFKNSVGRRYLQGLFYETTLADKETVVYTLKEVDHEGYPSLRRLYLETGDITEYSFAIQHLDGWSHWQELVAAKWFEPYLLAWREELRVKIESEALARILAIAENKTHPSGLTANKMLLERAESPAGAGKRGRPSKGSRVVEKTLPEASLAEMNETAKRIGLQ